MVESCASFASALLRTARGLSIEVDSEVERRPLQVISNVRGHERHCYAVTVNRKREIRALKCRHPVSGG